MMVPQEYHLTGMEMQLRQLKAAFGLAVALNRTIIMPKVGEWGGCISSDKTASDFAVALNRNNTLSKAGWVD